MKPGELERLQATENGLYKAFKLMTSINTGQMHAFDSNSCLRKYETPADILKEFYGVRYKYYQLRKDYQIGQFGAVANSLSARARFIEEKCSGKLVVENKKRKELMKELAKLGYPTDPIAEWKKKDVNSAHMESSTGGNADEEQEDTTADDGGYDFNYLVGMSMWFLTEEKKQQLLREREQKLAELSALKMLSLEQMWLNELDQLEVALDTQEQKERLELENAGKEKKPKGKAAIKSEPVKRGKGAKGASRALEDFKPSADAMRIEFQLSEAEKAKYVKAEPKPAGEGRVKKEKGVKGEKDASVVGGGEGGGVDGVDDIDAMIAGKKKATTAAAKPRVKKEKDADGMKQSKLDFSGAAAKKKRTPKKKKGSDSEDEGSDGGASNSDIEFNINEVVPARERPSGRAASKKIAYNFDEDEDEEEEGEKSDGEPELFENTMVDESVAKVTIADSEDEEEEGDARQENGEKNMSAEAMFDSLRETPAKGKKAAAPKKAPAAKRKPKEMGSDEDGVKKVRGEVFGGMILEGGF